MPRQTILRIEYINDIEDFGKIQYLKGVTFLKFLF